MRLTLRTLLAYIDDVLDPADKEDLAKKIEASDFAEELMHRTRDTMRRLRLSAPQVVGHGMGLDPNTVAEYLDNVLPPEHVGDFERICLESDVHLAEAAACHHVLTMVLGEPADVEPRSKQRMYGIATEAHERKRMRVEAAHVPMTTAVVTPAVPPGMATVASTAGPAVAPPPRTAVEVPEYLRARPWWQSPMFLGALAAVLLVGVGVLLWSAVSGFEGDRPATAKADASRDATPIAPAPPAEVQDFAAEDEAGEAPTGEDAMARADEQALEPAAPTLPTPPQPGTPELGATETAPRGTARDALAQETEHATIDEQDIAAPVDLEAATATGEEEPDRYAVTPQAPSDDAADGRLLPGVPAAAASPTEEAPLLAALPREPVTGLEEAPQSEPETVSQEPAPVAPEQDVDDAAVEGEVPDGPPELGTYLGGRTVLVRFEEEPGAWFRALPRDAVVAGQWLVALPEFRPKVTLAAGLHMDIPGGTKIVLLAGDAVVGEGVAAAGAEVPAIDIGYGRVVLINTAMGENRVRLKFGSTVADARLARNATLAIEVVPQFVPGTDPRTTPAPLAARLYAPDGGVTWQDAQGELSAESASQWSLANGTRSQIEEAGSMPEWLDQEPAPQSSEQRFGAPVIESTLVSNRPVDIQLLELYQSSARREVKSLVTRCSVHVGLFEPFVEGLRDAEQRANWQRHIEALRKAMASSPQAAEGVHQALVAQRGERAAADLYEMLCGYGAAQIGRTPEQWKTGALARLIDLLEDESLDYRVLAVHCLAEITGKRLMSNPASSTADRAQAVRTWRRRLASGELRPVGQAAASTDAAE
jgi:hypothetical protein